MSDYSHNFKDQLPEAPPQLQDQDQIQQLINDLESKLKAMPKNRNDDRVEEKAEQDSSKRQSSEETKDSDPASDATSQGSERRASQFGKPFFVNADDDDLDVTQLEGGNSSLQDNTQRPKAPMQRHSNMENLQAFDRSGSRIEPRLKSKRVQEDSARVHSEVTLGNMEDKDKANLQDSVPSSFYDQPQPHGNADLLNHVGGAAKDNHLTHRDNSLSYYGQSISVSMNQINDQEKRDEQIESKGKRGANVIEDQFNKKQMEFKGGKLHQMISDQPKNSNKIFANRYQGAFGLWYFTIDTTFHFENVLAVILFFLILYSQEYNQIQLSFPIIALSVNFGLMCMRNLTLEYRQRKVTNKINNKQIEYLMISRKIKRFLPITWADAKPGYILRIKSGQEFPADCLILDIQGAAGQKCFVTSGPFDDSTGIIQKKSYAGTSNKTGSKQNEQHLADMVSGFLKYEYNYFGYIQGTFKLNENPASAEFDHDNVVQRGALLTQTPQVICLVLNVGDQCMGSVYKDPKSAMDTTTTLRLRSMVKTQRSFDKAYKHSIRIFLMSLAILYLVFSGLAIYLASNDKFFSVTQFEKTIMESIDINTLHYIRKCMGFFSILLSSIPLSFSNIIDLLVLTHTNFAEWDINITPAAIEFLYPHATLAFGKVAHMFFSRTALLRDDLQSVKVFHVGGHFFQNRVSQQHQEKLKAETSLNSFNEGDENNSMNDTFEVENSLDYVPNELKFSTKFQNEMCDLILQGESEEDNKNKLMLTEFFRGITLCHQASVARDLSQPDLMRYICVLHDEITSLEFAQQQDFKLVQRGKKMMTILMQGKQERYEELGVVTTKAVMGHFMTVSAMRLQGKQAGVLYMKGSIASLKHYFVNKDNDFQYLNLFEQKFIQSGVQAIVYAKRQLTIEETNQLIITINEGIQSTRENIKLDNLLYNLTSIQLEILGVLGVQRPIHLRNRVVVDDMILNGVKPWIVSKEDEQTHLTCLNSLRIFQNCAQPVIINGQRERIVMEQIHNALKLVTDRMSSRQEMRSSLIDESLPNTVSDGTSRNLTAKGTNNSKQQKNDKMRAKLQQNEREQEAQRKKDSKEMNRNVVIFTGRALVEILRDQTMQKSFMTLAYISDMLVGSEISPLQKQKLLKIAKSYIGEGEYAAAMVATTEDQFMANEADLVANFKTRGKSADFQAVSDVTFKDFSAISYLLFKHGNQIQMRLSKAAQAFFYRSLVTFLILATYMIESGFSGAMPYTNFYYFIFMLFLAPGEILIYAIFYKDFAYDYLYRIFGHYKYNFSFSLVETEFVVIDSICAIFDWCIIYLPFELFHYGDPISLIDGKNISKEAYNCYQVILMQITFFFYFKNTNVQVIYSLNMLAILTLIGIAMIFDDDGLVGTTQLFTCPTFLLGLFFQVLMLWLRNNIIEVCAKLLIRRYADLFDWYQNVEERLSYEEYEDPNQTFMIQQFPPLYQKINSATIQNTLRLINTNMMKCPKTDGLENILDKINIELDNDMRGSQQVAMSGAINRWTLQLNDLNKETEYQDNKNSREIIYVKRQMIVFIVTTLLFAVMGLILSLTLNYTNIGIYYYCALSLFSIIVYNVLPRVTTYLSNVLLFYTVVVIFCYTIYTSESESLQPTGLIFVLALVAGLNHSYIYITMIMIVISVMMNIFFSFLTETDSEQLGTFVSTFNTFVRIFTAIVWSSYVYIQELEKKTQYVNGHRRVRNFLKLKSILNIMVPSLVRDKIRSGKKNFSDEEGEVTIVFIDIHHFDSIVNAYSGNELLIFLDQVYNAFDQLCDQFGLQKIETVGKTYMACGGLKSAEKKIDARLLNRHHSVRVTDFAVEVSNYVKTLYLKTGKHLEVKIGIHTGPVISGVVGETKPQFSLIGDTVNKTSRVCTLSIPLKVSVSKETHHYLELYTNNYMFQVSYAEMKGLGKQPIFIVSTMKGRGRQSQNMSDKVGGASKTIDMPNQQTDGATGGAGEKAKDEGDQAYQLNHSGEDNKMSKEAYKVSKEQQIGLLYESNSADSASVSQHNDFHDMRLGDREIQSTQQYDQLDDASNKSDQIDEGTMNVFGFNDDVNADDRIIVQNPTDNQIYNLVERPKYLLSFELKDSEQEFLYIISKQEARKTTMYLAQLILLNKIVIFGDILQDGVFEESIQFYVMFPIFILELVLIYRLNNPTFEYIYFWTYLLLIYGIIVLIVLLSYQAKYLGSWTITGFNELQIQLTISLIFMMRNVLLRHYIITYTVYMITWFVVVTLLATKFEYQIIQFILGQIMYSILLGVGIHHREMIQRKSLNYEKILDVQIEQTNNLISKLVPFHMLAVIKNEKRQVDEFEDLTLLYTDMVGFTAFSKNVKDPREVVNLLSKLFSRFDQLCEENRVYKVHTIGDCYVIMGYNGRVDKMKRSRAIVIDEANRVILTGLEMIDIIREVAEASEDKSLRTLDMRIGIHTGRVVAGIIGSKVVRYDIFGEGVLIANKMESNGIPGRVCVSEDTKRYLALSQEIYNDYQFEEHKTINLTSIDRQVKSYSISRREQETIESAMLSSNKDENMADKTLTDSQLNDAADHEKSINDGDDGIISEMPETARRPLIIKEKNQEVEMKRLRDADN